MQYATHTCGLFSQSAIRTPYEKNSEIGPARRTAIIALAVVDMDRELAIVNAQTFVGTQFWRTCRKKLRSECLEAAETSLVAIANRAMAAGITCETYTLFGQFCNETIRIIKQRNPHTVILGRSMRPGWMRWLVGSPAKAITACVTCRVYEDGHHIFA